MHFRKREPPNADADRAILNANVSLQRVQARTPEVLKVADAVKETIARNHFAEQLYSIIFREGK